MPKEVRIKEFDLKKHGEVLEEFNTTEWALSDGEHIGEVSKEYSKKKYIYVARDEEDAVVGYVVMETNNGVAALDAVIVKLSERGKGIGKVLIGHVIDAARHKECHVIKLETGMHWKARPFYEKFGFKIRAVLPNYYANQEFVLMDLRLSGADVL
ncbi:MAG: hypothetical protein RJB39_318 [Candidatus Parcubacteria bacterium]|jgi:ribosomal protein S18 acetylase RimI-like enzyme